MIDRKHELVAELARLDAEIDARFLSDERVLEEFASIAEAGLKVARDNAVIAPGKSVQTTLANWVAYNPRVDRFRRLVGPGLTNDLIVDLVVRWPDSKPEIVKLIEERGARG